MEAYLASIDDCRIMKGQTGQWHPNSQYSRILANTSTHGGKERAPTVGYLRLLTAAAADPDGPLAFILEVEAELDEACPPLTTGNRGLSEMPGGAEGGPHPDQPDEPGRSHPVQFSQHQSVGGPKGPELPDGERRVLDVTSLYAFAGAANGEDEYAEGETAHHHRMRDRSGMVAARSFARLIDRQRDLYYAGRVQKILLRRLVERSRTHGLTFAKSQEPFTIPEWRQPEVGPDGAVDCVAKGACAEVQMKKNRLAFQSHMRLAAAISDAAKRQGLASGDGSMAPSQVSVDPVAVPPAQLPIPALAHFHTEGSVSNGGVNSGSGLAEEPRSGREATKAAAVTPRSDPPPTSARPQPASSALSIAPFSGGGLSGGFGGGNRFNGHASTRPTSARPPPASRSQSITPFSGGGLSDCFGGGIGGGSGVRFLPHAKPHAPVTPTTENRLGLKALPADNQVESTARFMQSTYKAHANEQRIEQDRQPLKKNAAQRHDWESDKGLLAAVHAKARQEHVDILQGGAPARRKRQHEELRKKGWQEWTECGGEHAAASLESIEADDDALLEDFRERKWGSVPQSKKGKKSAKTHGSATITSGQGGFPVRFVECTDEEHVDLGTLTRCSTTTQVKEQLCIEMHKCRDPDCPIRRDGGWTRGLADIKKAMRNDGDNFWIGNNKDRSIKKKLVRA